MSDTSANVATLFNPHRIALVGASPKSNFFRRVLSNLRLLGFGDERIFLVNPNYSAIEGRRCYSTLDRIPETIDVAMVLTPKTTVPTVVREAVSAGIKGAVVLASGFAETGPDGAELQKQITSIACDHAVVCGPNTMGLASFPNRLALFSGELPASVCAGPLSAVFQSGGMLNVFLQVCAYRRIGMSRLVVTGNEAVLTLADYLSFYAEDPDTQWVAIHVESIRDGDKLRRALHRCRENQKPVVALLVGKSARARQTVQAHSGNLVASSKWEEALKGYGVMVVNNLDEMVNVCSLLAHLSLERLSKGVQLATVSGGDCSWLSDLADTAGVELPSLSEGIRDALKPILRKERFIDNPLDVGGLPRSGDDRFERTIDAVCQSPGFSMIALRLNYPSPCTETAAMPYRIAAKTARRHGKQPVFLTRASEALGDDWMECFANLKAPFLLEYEKGLRAIRIVQDYCGAREGMETEPAEQPNDPAVSWLFAKSGSLTFWQAIELLDYYKIPVVQSKTASSPDDAIATAHSLGFPVALKVDSKEIAHKTEIGGVALSLDTDEEVRRAYGTIVKNIEDKVSSSFSMILQPMVQNGVEVLLGVVNDPEVGPLIVVALGGIFTEVLRDSAVRPVPVSQVEARRMIMSLKGKDLLLGARGRPEADVEELTQVVHQLSLLGRDCSDRLQELDLNPVIVLPKGQGLKVVDALVVLKD
ncbi:MAG: acetate--CoA ligase family protein [Candidatus Binatia bacterium]